MPAGYCVGFVLVVVSGSVAQSVASPIAGPGIGLAPYFRRD